MQKISETLKRAYKFYKDKIKRKDFVIYGTDFPDEYVRRFLQKEDLSFPVKKGLYVLKNKGEDAKDLVYRLYWPMVVKLLEIYEPWSLEKESALALYLGDESIPQKLLIRTSRRVNYSFALPLDLEIDIRYDRAFHEKTRRQIEVGKVRVYLDVPERVLFNLQKRKGIKFITFVKSLEFDRRMLEVLYSVHPKPVVIKELIKITENNSRVDLSQALKDILKRYTIYRP